MHEFWQQLPINIIGALALLIFNHMKNKQKETDDAIKELSREIQGVRVALAEQTANVRQLSVELSYSKSSFRNGPGG